nr:hypothetical protein [Tanacetum cinerariifolium]
MENNDVASKTIKEKFTSLPPKFKVTRKQTSDNSDSQRGKIGSVTRVIDPEEAAKIVLGIKEAKSKDKSMNAIIAREEGHFIGEYPKPKEKNGNVGGAWSDSEDDNELQKDATMALDSQE